jgi:hypothetical protein
LAAGIGALALQQCRRLVCHVAGVTSGGRMGTAEPSYRGGVGVAVVPCARTRGIQRERGVNFGPPHQSTAGHVQNAVGRWTGLSHPVGFADSIPKGWAAPAASRSRAVPTRVCRNERLSARTSCAGRHSLLCAHTVLALWCGMRSREVGAVRAVGERQAGRTLRQPRRSGRPGAGRCLNSDSTVSPHLQTVGLRKLHVTSNARETVGTYQHARQDSCRRVQHDSIDHTARRECREWLQAQAHFHQKGRQRCWRCKKVGAARTYSSHVCAWWRDMEGAGLGSGTHRSGPQRN